MQEPKIKELTIRFATKNDASLIHHLICELAEFEKLRHEVVATPALLEQTLFGPDKPVAEVLIAELGGVPTGMALFFHSYSTFLAKPGLYLEDLFVLPEYRSQNIGKQLLMELVKIAAERGCGRLEWSVLKWNQRAIDFYLKLGAKPQQEWTVFRLGPEELKRLSSVNT